MKIQQSDSLLYQSIAMCMLLSELHHKNFLESDFYKKYCFQDDLRILHDGILAQSGIGNPATLQAMYYLLLLCPKEILTEAECLQIDKLINIFCQKNNVFCKSLYHSDTENINFARHFRNAIAHSHCKFHNIDNSCYITIEDYKNCREKFELTISISNAGLLLDKLQDLMVSFLNRRYHSKG